MADKLPWGLKTDGLTPGSAKVCRLFQQNLSNDSHKHIYIYLKYFLLHLRMHSR